MALLQLDARDAAGASPLHLAADAPIAAVLLASDAPVNAVNNAGQCGAATPAAAILIAVCEDLVLLAGQQGRVLVHYHVGCAAHLVRQQTRGTSVVWPSPAAETPLFGAAATGATGLIRVLARSGAHLDQQDDCGETALIRACSRWESLLQCAAG